MSLEWFIGSNGQHFADHENTRYCIAYLKKGTYSIAANGKEFAIAPSVADAKLIARRESESR